MLYLGRIILDDTYLISDLGTNLSNDYFFDQFRLNGKFNVYYDNIYNIIILLRYDLCPYESFNNFKFKNQIKTPQKVISLINNNNTKLVNEEHNRVKIMIEEIHKVNSNGGLDNKNGNISFGWPNNTALVYLHGDEMNPQGVMIK